MKMKRNYFSLIELLIVIAIIGALTALILPQFDASETEAKDTGCDYSQYGTMRTLTQYHSINGVYPTGWHTGLESQATTTDVMGTTETLPEMPDITGGNVALNSTISALTQTEVDSLKAAGIGSLGYGYGVDAKPIETTTTAIKMSAQWYEDASAEDKTAGSEEPVTFNGTPWESNADVTGLKDKFDSVIILWSSPTVDWENYYIDGDLSDGQPSKVSVAQEGKCPWVKEIFGYYMGYFGIKEGKKAKLVGTSCPECGPLNP